MPSVKISRKQRSAPRDYAWPWKRLDVTPANPTVVAGPWEVRVQRPKRSNATFAFKKSANSCHMFGDDGDGSEAGLVWSRWSCVCILCMYIYMYVQSLYNYIYIFIHTYCKYRYGCIQSYPCCLTWLHLHPACFVFRALHEPAPFLEKCSLFHGEIPMFPWVFRTIFPAEKPLADGGMPPWLRSTLL